jgi:hypothetical protein
MDAKFLTVGSFLVRSRDLFVLVGDVVEGKIEAGMVVILDLGNLKVEVPIRDVEVIDVSFRGQSYRGLVIGFEDPEDIRIWDGIDFSGQTLEVTIQSTHVH